MTSSFDGRIHLEPGHRAVAETVAARLKASAGKRESVKVECSDFDGVRYRVETMDDKDTLCLSLAVRNFAEIKDAVGEKYFLDKYPGMTQPEAGFSLTVKVSLTKLPNGSVDTGLHLNHPPANPFQSPTQCSHSNCQPTNPPHQPYYPNTYTHSRTRRTNLTHPNSNMSTRIPRAIPERILLLPTT